MYDAGDKMAEANEDCESNAQREKNRCSDMKEQIAKCK